MILLLGTILYNPIVPVHLGDRDVWQVINLLTIPTLVYAEAWTAFDNLEKKKITEGKYD